MARIMSKKEIERLRADLQKIQDRWGDFEKGFYGALCEVLGDRPTMTWPRKDKKV